MLPNTTSATETVIPARWPSRPSTTIPPFDQTVPIGGGSRGTERGLPYKTLQEGG